MKKKLLVSIFSLLLIHGISWAQERVVSGKVTSQDDGSSLPGVNVVVKGTTNGTVTDTNGQYQLSVASDGGTTLIFTFIGFQTQEVQVGQRSIVDVNLITDVTQLEEVIVTAYGTTTKEAFTGSAGVVSSSQLLTRNVTSPIAALEGNVTGVQFTSPAGPGESPSIVIRGVGTLNGETDPLYIVDGVQYNAPLNTLNQEDIESFTVLKDAASTALYGSRAANGVVMITTKKGKKGVTKVNASAQTGLVNRAIPVFDRVTPGQYYEGMWEALRNTSAAGGDPNFATQNIYNQLGYNPFNVPNDQIVGVDGRLSPNAEVIYQSLDWFDQMEQTGIRNNYNLNISGGGENHSLFFSTSYLDDESFVITSGFKRLTSRLNGEFQVNDRLKFGGSTNIALTEINGPTSGGTGSIVNPFGFAQGMGSIYPVFVNDLQGNIVRDAAGNPVWDNGEGFPAFNIGTRPRNVGRHAIQELTLNNDLSEDNTYGLRLFGDVKIIDGLNFRMNYGADFIDYFDNSYENPVIGDAQPVGRLDQERRRVNTQTFNQILTYTKSFGRHGIDLTAGHESFEITDSEMSGLKTTQTASGIHEFANFSTIIDLDGFTFDRALEGYFLRANYDFDGKYFLSASVRRDGSSSFESDQRWGNFYSVGAAWRLDQEAFFPNVDWMNRLKLRATFGQVGNDNLGNREWYISQALFQITQNANSPAILFNSLGNAALQWETSESYDVALEFGLFNNFLEGSIEYYRRNSTELLFNLPIAPSNGLNELVDNVADMFNSGFELGLTAHLLNKGALQWDMTVLGTTLKNQITSLPTPFISGSKRWAEGRSRFDFFLYETAGVDPQTGDQLYFQYDTDGMPVLDAEGKHLTTNDWSTTQRGYVEASSVPDFLGSVSNTLRYKGFDFNFLVTYGIGGEVLDNGYSAMMHAGTYGASWHPDILKAWKQPGDITDVPRLQNGDQTLVQTQSSRFITDASFMAIRNANLGYKFNSAMLNRLGLSSLRVSLTGENLFLKSKRVGLDPQFNLAGTGSGNDFVPGRIFSLGLDLSF